MSLLQLNKLALRVHEVADQVGVSERHIWALVAQGKFPKPIKLGASTRWLYDDIVQFCRKKGTSPEGE